MYGGDEVGAVVIDVGSSTARFGFSGEDTPKAVFDSAIGYTYDQAGSSSSSSSSSSSAAASQAGGAMAPPKRRFYTGRAQHTCRSNMEIQQPLQSGLVTDWEALEAIWEYGLQRHLCVRPADHPFLIAEPVHNTHAHRERYLQLAFETFQTPALFMCKTAPLAAFSAGKSTALVVDSGGGMTTTSVVHDGYIMHKSVLKTSFAGDTLDHLLENALFTSKGQAAKPRYQLKREVGAGGEVTVRDLRADELPANVTQSYHRLQCLQLLKDIRQTTCRVSETPFDKESAEVTTKSYELPDGNTLSLENERMETTERLWQPLPAELASLQAPEISNGFTFNGLQHMARDTVWSCDPDLRKELLSSVVAVGGTMLTEGVTQRLTHELTQLFSDASFKVKVLSVASATERRFATWVGGSILASLGSFHQLWFSRKEYEDKGPSQLAYRCP